MLISPQELNVIMAALQDAVMNHKREGDRLRQLADYPKAQQHETFALACHGIAEKIMKAQDLPGGTTGRPAIIQ